MGETTRVMRMIRIAALALASLALQGCLARAAVNAVTLPVKVASRGVDLATESQSEADEKRGREIRKREERLGSLERDYERQMDRCADGDDEACDRAQGIRAEMKALMPGVPLEPEAD
jgi:hypothetical protein